MKEIRSGDRERNGTLQGQIVEERYSYLSNLFSCSCLGSVYGSVSTLGCLGMKCAKCFGILVEGQGDRAGNGSGMIPAKSFGILIEEIW
jgi:hypothetical protein